MKQIERRRNVCIYALVTYVIWWNNITKWRSGVAKSERKLFMLDPWQLYWKLQLVCWQLLLSLYWERSDMQPCEKQMNPCLICPLIKCWVLRAELCQNRRSSFVLLEGCCVWALRYWPWRQRHKVTGGRAICITWFLLTQAARPPYPVGDIQPPCLPPLSRIWF
jgi:hypothetical protein